MSCEQVLLPSEARITSVSSLTFYTHDIIYLLSLLCTPPTFTMPAARSMLAATQDCNASVFSTFKKHNEAQRTDTKTTALTVIRSAYPDYHVTEVDEFKISLREFAAADQASLVLDTEDEIFYATREWHAVGEGIEKDMNPGDLKDEFRFAR